MPDKATSILERHGHQDEARLSRMIAEFVQRWGPQGSPYEAGVFHARLHEIVRATYAAAQEPLIKHLTTLISLSPPSERRAHETLVDTYRHALGMI